MSSLAHAAFSDALRLGRTLQSAAHDVRTRPISHQRKSDFLHASLAAYVAAWDSYVNAVVREFLKETSNTLDSDFSARSGLLLDFVEAALNRFNTPNSDNTRRLLIQCTGYDPIGDWVWHERGLSGLDTRNFLDQILKVRHSFAHGFALPSFDWTKTPKGKLRLNKSSLEVVEKFFIFLVDVIDQRLSSHGRNTYVNHNLWGY
ncbi:HEPN domain-containing protein [Paracoccus sp. ME4]|uniref:HEPN domain-containing protein n=1 Tax=Paracoccus sp. ME4 TaxID=3138066 RepID=UPI00398AFE3F